MKKILVIGGGGHARVLLDALEAGRRWRAAGVVDPGLAAGTLVQGARVLGADDMLPRFFKKGVKHCIIAVGGASDAPLRPRLARMLAALGFKFVSVVHPRAVVSRHAVLGNGVFVAAGAVINPGARVGDHAIVNTGAVVDHDCLLGAFAHIAPGAVLAGAVSVGEAATVGAGAAVRPGITIGAGALVGAGSAVVADVPAGAVAYGNPCRAAGGKK